MTPTAPSQSDVQNAALAGLYIPLYHRYSKPPAGWDDNEFEHFFTFTNNANQTLLNQPMQIATDADFYWRGVQIQTLFSGGGAIKVRFRDSYGNYLESIQSALGVPSLATPPFFENLGGSQGGTASGALCYPMFPEIFCPRNGSLFVDLIEYLGSSCTSQILLTGVQRRPIQRQI
jgi:hypothetical protein